jgi:hypothetical protein
MANISNNYDDPENFLAALPFCLSSSIYIADDDINATFKSKQDVVPSFSV